MDGSDQTKQPAFLAAMIICLCMLVVSLGARLYAQQSIKHLWELDNVLIMFASICFRSDVTSQVLIAKTDTFDLGFWFGDDRDMPCGITVWHGSSRG
jgi:hypothetical protein